MTPGPPPVTLQVFLVHRDQPELCARSVAAFLAQGVDVAVTVVDNGSSPEGLRRLRRLVPSTEIVATGQNMGFGPGANVGLRRWLAGDGGEWVAVAPHDAIPQPGCLARLLREAGARAGAGLLSAEFGPGYDFVPALDKVLGGFYRPSARGQGWQDADYPHGTLLLARRAALEDIGVFDERYFAYCEEVDLGVRARRAGWAVGIVWGAVVANARLPARQVADYLQVRNTLLLVRETYGAYFAAWRCVLAAWQLGAGALRHRGGAGPGLRPGAWAIGDFLRGRFGPPPGWVLAGEGRAAPSTTEAAAPGR